MSSKIKGRIVLGQPTLACPTVARAVTVVANSDVIMSSQLMHACKRTKRIRKVNMDTQTEENRATTDRDTEEREMTQPQAARSMSAHVCHAPVCEHRVEARLAARDAVVRNRRLPERRRAERCFAAAGAALKAVAPPSTVEDN